MVCGLVGMAGGGLEVQLIFSIVNKSNQFHFKSSSKTNYKHKSLNHSEPTGISCELLCRRFVVGSDGNQIDLDASRVCIQ